jgi:cytochrome c biogenesis protein CcmG, thiol:disulfide interchange protein DsbE
MRLRPVLIAVLVSAVCASCHGGPMPSQATASPGLPRDPTSLPTVDYETYQKIGSGLVGKPVVVNIWSSWCGPCRKEAPLLAAAGHEYGDRIQFLGIDILDTKAAAAKFVQEFGLPYPSLFDPTGDIRDRLGYIGQPETLFYDSKGTVALSWPGPLTEDALTNGIDRILPPAAA